jgi:hypothetical protein
MIVYAHSMSHVAATDVEGIVPATNDESGGIDSDAEDDDNKNDDDANGLQDEIMLHPTSIWHPSFDAKLEALDKMIPASASVP